MALHLLACGSNYEGTPAELPDCQLDLVRWCDLLSQYTTEPVELIGKKWRPINAVRAVEKIAAKKKSTDATIVFYSGHGTSELVAGKQQQGIVFDDLTVAWEKACRSLFEAISPVIFVVDCCFAHGLDRGGKRQARFIPYAECRPSRLVVSDRVAAPIHAKYYASSAKQTAASTGNGGAFSNAALEVLAKYGDAISFERIHKEIRKLLPSDEYPQSPQFVCTNASFAKRTLRSFNKVWNKK